MSYPQTAESRALPLPLKGLNRRDPLFGMDENYTPWLVNIDIEGQYLKLRKGYRQYCKPNSAYWVSQIGVYGNPWDSSSYKMFSYVTDDNPTPAQKADVYDVSTSTPSLSTTTTGTTEELPVCAFNANKRLFFMTETNPGTLGLVYNGSSWSAWGFTYSASAIGGRVGLSYRDRIYFFSGTSMYYGDSKAVSGATSKVDFDEVFRQPGNICWASVLSSPGERPAELYMAFGNLAGEVVLYSGSYPASSTWQLVGRYKISAPIGYNSVIEYGNDTWIITKTGVVSLADLVSKGRPAVDEESPSYLIQNYWCALAATLDASIGINYAVTGCYWPERNKIFILMPGHYDKTATFDGTSFTMFVYDCNTRSWGLHRITGIEANHAWFLTYYNNNIYFACGGTIMTLSSSSYEDQEYGTAINVSAYDFEVCGTHSNLGSNNKNKIIKGWEPVIKTDFAACKIGMKTIIDIERETTTNTYPALVDGVNATTFLTGGRGTTFQWSINGESDTSSTDGLEIYAMGVVI